jgi:hypothetical protein
MTPAQTAEPYEVVRSEHGYWELRRQLTNGSESIYPFKTAEDAEDAAIERGLPYC